MHASRTVNQLFEPALVDLETYFCLPSKSITQIEALIESTNNCGMAAVLDYILEYIVTTIEPCVRTIIRSFVLHRIGAMLESSFGHQDLNTF